MANYPGAPVEARRFTDAASEVKFIHCDPPIDLGGSIDYYRFASRHARARAVVANLNWLKGHY